MRAAGLWYNITNATIVKTLTWNLLMSLNSRPHDQPGWEGQSNSPSGTRYNNTFKLGDISGRAGGFSQNISVQV